MKEIYLAGGCFWGLQKFFDQFDGVVSTEVGYANGPDCRDGHWPTYEEVCRSSGHAETVKITYDEKRIGSPCRSCSVFISWSSTLCLSTDRGMTGESSTAQESILRTVSSCRRYVLSTMRSRNRQGNPLLWNWNRSGTSFPQRTTTRNIWRKIPGATATFPTGITILQTGNEVPADDTLCLPGLHETWQSRRLIL